MYEWVVKGKKRKEKIHCETCIYLKTVYENTMNKCELK